MFTIILIMENNSPFNEINMKLKDILKEMPHDLGSDAPFNFKISNFEISSNALNREFEFLGDLQMPSNTFSFWIRKNKSSSVITIKGEYRNDVQYNDIITEVNFNNRFMIDVKNQLQVSKAVTIEQYRSYGLSLAMYVVLARYGYTVVSDYEQFAGGINLWRKIARESNFRNYVVRIWSDNLEDWIRNDNGDIVKYDGTNIDQSDIWNDTGRKYDPTSLLVLTSK